jgi:hypothetical protein
MTDHTSSIDDILLNQTPLSTQTPDAPEIESDTPATEIENQYDLIDNNPPKVDKEPVKVEKEQASEDDYGNQETKENEAIRERLARQARKHEAEVAALHARYNAEQQQQVQKATRDFEYDENSEGDWQQQLESFVKKTVQNMGAETRQQQERQREIQAQAEFEVRFNQDAERFGDFEDTMAELKATLSPPMVYATRAMKNPAAFLYAAAKKNPAELERIASMQDPYAQVAAIGALEVSLRKQGSQTKAPKPIGRGHEDGNIPKAREAREESIEEKMHAFEAQKRKRMAIGKR